MRKIYLWLSNIFFKLSYFFARKAKTDRERIQDLINKKDLSEVEKKEMVRLIARNSDDVIFLDKESF